MGLEVRVYKDVSEYSSRPLWGLSWRQIGALAVMIFAGGGVFVGTTVLALNLTGKDWSEVNSVSQYGMVAMLIVLIPAAAYGWWRPLGLRPGIYLPFVFRQFFMKGTVEYGTDNQPESVRERSRDKRSRRETRREAKEHRESIRE